MTKFFSYTIGALLGVIAILASSLFVFLQPMFQTDEMLAQIRVEHVEKSSGKTCYIVSLEVVPGNDEAKRDKIIDRKPICGDFLGLGYEFTLPKKTFFLMKKPGILVTNLVAFDDKSRDQTGNLAVGRYQIELMESLRNVIGDFLKNTPMVQSITYDIKALMKTPRQGAVITYTLEPFRQHVLVECAGCEE